MTVKRFVLYYTRELFTENFVKMSVHFKKQITHPEVLGAMSF